MAHTVESFITLMDSLKLNMVSVDQVRSGVRVLTGWCRAYKHAQLGRLVATWRHSHCNLSAAGGLYLA